MRALKGAMQNMLNPSYSSLIRTLNEDNSLDNKITSRYSIVIAAARRARQIVAGAQYDSTGIKSDKAVSIAVSEMERGQLRITPISEGEEIEKNNQENQEENTEDTENNQDSQKEDIEASHEQQ